jgi:hypothetical protein
MNEVFTKRYVVRGGPPEGVEPRQGWRANHRWFERREEPRLEVIRNTTAEPQEDAVNDRAPKSVEESLPI